jgi:type VI secretion system secreted protein Hcp
MAANMFVYIKDIVGDATEDKHPKWIVVQSVDWEVARAVDINDIGGTQRGHANATFGKVSVTSELGKASNALKLSVANGTIRPEIKIDCCRSGEDAASGLEPYLMWKLAHVQIDSYTVSCSADGVPTETWTLAYRKIEIEYKETDPTTAKLSKVDDFKWNLETGKVG